MSRVSLIALVVSFVLLTPPAPADEGVRPLTPEELIALEEVRSATEDALALFAAPAADGFERIENATRAAESLLPFGADVVPFLESELEQRLGNYDFCAYVLGRMRVKESEQALERALRRSEDEPGDRGRVHEAWAAWGLALHGRTDFIEALPDGRHESATYAMHADTSVLEVIGMLTAPASVPHLERMLDRFAKDPERISDLMVVLRALQRIGEPSVVPKMIPVLGHERRSVRATAAASLQTLLTPESVSALIAALGDEESIVRRSAADALDRLGVTDRVDPIAAHLAGEDDTYTRGVLYRVLAKSGGDVAWRALADAWGRPVPLDRRRLIEAYAVAGSRFADRIDEALGDADPAVVSSAIAATRTIHGKNGTVLRLLAAMDRISPRAWLSLANHLLELRPPAFGAPIAAALTGGVLDGARKDRRHVTVARRLGEVLVATGHHQALEALRAQLETSDEPLVDSIVRSLVTRLEAIRTHGDDVDAWSKLLAPDQAHEMRTLAATHLARLSGPEAHALLVEAFDALDLDDRHDAALGETIIFATLDHPSPTLHGLCARVLSDPAFDPHARHQVRNAAAWVARKSDVPELVGALVATVERRSGRDFVPLVYAALALGRDGAELLDRFRLPRLEYMSWDRGSQQERLDYLSRVLAEGRPVPLFLYDEPPVRLRP